MSLSNLLTSLQKSSNSGWGTSSSGWSGSSHTWGGSPTKLPKVGKKTSESQTVANKIMSGAKEKASHSHENVLGRILGGASDTVGNLADDIVSTAENTPSGLLKIATTNPVDTAKAIGTDYKTRYGKLFSGDFGGFAHQLEQHPLGYILDAATLGTAGAGGLARVGVLSKELSTTGLSLDRAATAAGDSARVPVNLSLNPFTRVVQKGTYKVQSHLPENIPIVGENAAASRAVAQDYRHAIANPNNFEFTDASKVRNPLHQGSKAGSSYSTARGFQPEFIPGEGTPAVRAEFKAKYGDVSAKSLSKYNHAVGPGGLLGKSTQAWKDLVLAGRPAFQINNLVGNTIMAGSVLGKDFVKAQSLATKGELDTAANKFFSGTLHSFGGTEKSQAENPGLYRKAVNKSYNLQGKHETMLRKSVMYSASMKVPEIKAAVRHYTGQGLSEGDALTHAYTDLFKGEQGAALQREVRQKIDDTMGDYTRYTAGEQRLKKIVPFYGWNRHASRYLYATSRDRPGQLLALNQVSKIGKDAHNQWGFMGTPDFMNGYLKIGGHTFDTAPLNPLKGGTDTLKSVKEIISGNPSTEGTDLGSNLNPFISAGIQGLTGKNLLTGAPIPKTAHGLLGSVISQTVTGLPQVKLVEKALPQHGPDTSNPHTFLTTTGRLKSKFVDADTGHVKLGANGLPEEAPGRHMLNPTFQSLLATFLGVPDRGSVNIKTAQTVAKKIETDKDNGKFRPAKKRAKKNRFKAVANTQRAGSWGAGQSSWGG